MRALRAVSAVLLVVLVIIFIRPFEAGFTLAVHAIDHPSRSIAIAAIVSTMATACFMFYVCYGLILSLLKRQQASDIRFKTAGFVLLGASPVHILVGYALLNNSTSLLSW